MLRDLLGADFTPEASAAWARVYGALQAQMVAAAYGAVAHGDKA